MEDELKSLNRLQTLLAPWKICDETKENPDSEPDTIDLIIKQIQIAKCKTYLTCCFKMKCLSFLYKGQASEAYFYIVDNIPFLFYVFKYHKN